MRNRNTRARRRFLLPPLLLLTGSLLLLLAACRRQAPSVPAEETASAPPDTFTLTENASGQIGPFSFTYWMDTGEGEMTVRPDGSFSCRWERIGNALFRVGRIFSPAQPAADLGEVLVRYEADYAPAGRSFLCVYGWMEEPLAEYYIVENWGGERPAALLPIGSIRIDGGDYDVYLTVRENKPSISGDATFPQYWSVRREPRSGGEISVSAHFAAWAALGLELGGLREIALTVEGVESGGAADIRQNELLVAIPPEARDPVPRPASEP